MRELFRRLGVWSSTPLRTAVVYGGIGLFAEIVGYVVAHAILLARVRLGVASLHPDPIPWDKWLIVPGMVFVATYLFALRRANSLRRLEVDIAALGVHKGNE
jgi:hypothetical protein